MITDNITYQLLMIFLFTMPAIYINRRQFTTLQRSIGWGLYVPSFVVVIGTSILFGVAVWLILQLLFLHFQNPLPQQ